MLYYYFLHILTSASLITAQTNTYTALPSEAYQVTIENRPTPAPDEVLVQREDNGDINVFVGSSRLDSIKQARDACGGNIDLNCYNSVAKAWGYGQDGDEKGISKRFVQIPALLIAAFVFAAVHVFIGLIYTSLDGGSRMPAAEQEKFKHPFGDAEVYQSPDGAITIDVPAGPALSVPEEDAATVTLNADESTDITMADADVPQTKAAIKHIVCKRSMRFFRRQADDTLRECIEIASEDIAKNTDIGAWLQKFQGLRWVVNLPGAPDEVPLPAEFPDIPQGLQETVDLLSVFGEGAERVRTGIARFSLLLAWAQMEAGVEISGKMHIPAEKMKQKKPEDEDPGTCKTPHEAGNYFCDEECGGKNAAPGRPPQSVTRRQDVPNPAQPLDDFSKIWSCKGRDANDDRTGCDCVIPHPGEPHSYPGMTIGKAQEVFKGPHCDLNVCKKPGEQTPDPPVVNGDPTSEPSCFPTAGPPHDNPDVDQLIRICNFETRSTCEEQKLSLFCRSGAVDNALPVRNNRYEAFFDKDANAPADCNNIFNNDHENNPLPEAGTQLCSPALDAIIKACPWTGGEVRNVCGTFAVQSCPLGGACDRGNPLR